MNEQKKKAFYVFFSDLKFDLKKSEFKSLDTGSNPVGGEKIIFE